MIWVIWIVVYGACADPIETRTQYRYESFESCVQGIAQQAAQLHALMPPGAIAKCVRE